MFAIFEFNVKRTTFYNKFYAKIYETAKYVLGEKIKFNVILTIHMIVC